MLTLGKSLNRNYNIRVPFSDGFYDVGIFFNNKSTFLLFGVEPDFSSSGNTEIKDSVRVNMFKNIESSKFVETFLNLHNYRSNSLDILNQFKEVKPEFSTDINFIFNETLTLNKVVVDDKEFFDQLILYMFTITAYNNEFLYLIAERQNVISKLKKKLVRTSSIQISSNRALSLLDEFYEESKKSEKIYENEKYKIRSDEVIEIK